MSALFPQGSGFSSPLTLVANSNLAGVLNPHLFRFNNPALAAPMDHNPASISFASVLPALFAFGLNNLFARLTPKKPGDTASEPPFQETPQPSDTIQHREGGTEVMGQGENFVITDNKGDDTYKVGGSNNRVQVVGNKGQSIFHVGGQHNDVSIQDVFNNERIILEGQQVDWLEVPTKNDAGTVVYINRKTGTKASITAGGENSADFVRQRVSFSQQA